MNVTLVLHTVKEVIKMGKKILMADDESRMRILVSDFLKHEGYEIIEAKDGLEALNLFLEDPTIHLVILDIMMPNMNGLEACEKIREVSQVPIIMLTAKSAERDELTGFNIGADEYITKPFSPSILVARVNALLKRSYSEVMVIERGVLFIDQEQHEAKVRGEVVELSQTEYKLLCYLIDHENKVLSRDQILDSVWGYDYFGTDRTIDTHMNRLRVKLKDAGIYVKTIRGYGYKFEVTEDEIH